MFKGILVEFVITFVLVLVVYAAAADESNTVKGSAPLAIGLAITIGHLFAVSYLQS
jgi:aquaporin related protein